MHKNLFSIFISIVFLTLFSCEKIQEPHERFAERVNNNQFIPNTDAEALSWQNIDLNVPDVVYPEIRSKGVVVRSNEEYTVYSVGENVLFQSGSAQFAVSADTVLQQITTSAKGRYPGGWIGLYSSKSGKEIAERQDSLKKWFVRQGGFDSTKVSIRFLKKPDLNGNTSLERTENPRIEIAVVPKIK
ncbi:MAG TPA: hypothetical protein VEC36_04290 [Patescibacteria group bacterium]|nr:hypothetical protein [Patescibacteria group bacterium]